LFEYQALEGAELEEEGGDKEVHLMEMEEECVEEADEGDLLVLKRALSGHKVPNQENNVRISSTLGALSMAVCAHLLLMGVVVPMWLQLLWWRSSNSGPNLILTHTPFNDSIKVRDSKSLLIV